MQILVRRFVCAQFWKAICQALSLIIPPGCHFGFCHVFLWPVRQNTEILKDSTPETSNEYISTSTYPNHFKMPPAAFTDLPLTVRAIVIAF
jgi:hypothetical protein